MFGKAHTGESTLVQTPCGRSDSIPQEQTSYTRSFSFSSEGQLLFIICFPVCCKRTWVPFEAPRKLGLNFNFSGGMLGPTNIPGS